MPPSGGDRKLEAEHGCQGYSSSVLQVNYTPKISRIILFLYVNTPHATRQPYSACADDISGTI
jgi:hypothetical protein